jgi:hypothetical protein
MIELVSQANAMPSTTAVQIFPSEASPEAPFYIAATQAVGRPRRTLKDGDTFAVLDSHGDITATPSGPDGLFYQDRGISLISNCGSTKNARYCLAPIYATTILRSSLI